MWFKSMSNVGYYVFTFIVIYWVLSVILSDDCFTNNWKSKFFIAFWKCCCILIRCALYVYCYFNCYGMYYELRNKALIKLIILKESFQKLCVMQIHWWCLNISVGDKPALQMTFSTLQKTQYLTNLKSA